jgi:hypothetical protein
MPMGDLSWFPLFPPANKHHNQKQYSQVRTKCYGGAQTKERIIHKERVKHRDLQTWHLQRLSSTDSKQLTGFLNQGKEVCLLMSVLVTDWGVMIFTCEGRRSEKNTGYTHTHTHTHRILVSVTVINQQT